VLNIYYISHKALVGIGLKANYTKMQLNLDILLSVFKGSLLSVIVKPNGFFLLLKNNNFISFFKQIKHLFNFSALQLMDIIIVDRLEMKLFEKKNV